MGVVDFVVVTTSLESEVRTSRRAFRAKNETSVLVRAENETSVEIWLGFSPDESEKLPVFRSDRNLHIHAFNFCINGIFLFSETANNGE